LPSTSLREITRANSFDYLRMKVSVKVSTNSLPLALTGPDDKLIV
jgi:hypothetical protein